MNSSESIQLDIYLNHAGQCEEAFLFYAQHLGGSIKMMQIQQQPPPDFPKQWPRPVLHAIIEIGGVLIRGADVPSAGRMRSAYLTLRLQTAEKAEQLYELLLTDGEVFMKMEKTFFANRFAMLRDKFGTSWMLLHEG